MKFAKKLRGLPFFLRIILPVAQSDA
ncbi:hypothetical protein EMIT0111MI5_40045 [Burkholderia sp. IT-111MI5]